MWYRDKNISIDCDYVTHMKVVQEAEQDYRIRFYLFNNSVIDIVKDLDEKTAEKYFDNLLEDIECNKDVINGLRG